MMLCRVEKNVDKNLEESIRTRKPSPFETIFYVNKCDRKELRAIVNWLCFCTLFPFHIYIHTHTHTPNAYFIESMCKTYASFDNVFDYIANHPMFQLIGTNVYVICFLFPRTVSTGFD